LIVRHQDGRVLFLHGPEEDRWWLPGEDMQAYETPAEAVRRIIGKLGSLTWTEARLRGVDSFRGRRGWHVMFHYLVEATTLEPTSRYVCEWFPPTSLPCSETNKPGAAPGALTANPSAAPKPAADLTNSLRFNGLCMDTTLFILRRPGELRPTGARNTTDNHRSSL